MLLRLSITSSPSTRELTSRSPVARRLCLMWLISASMDSTTRALLQRAQEAGAQLVLVEGFAAAVLLDHPRHDQFGAS
jgi:hypothetical protein